ncbi:MFS transporter [Sphingomonas sp. So64.6b]|uniref:spinster family MFS transporter n=1 Tax=Sphingomonas sp. So64.6b TaxID=2997354 RepID=UPI0016014062|nr:MFS transporter [Sphingomonas sp. So64.6b]QNA85491.1 MFS transporter [Sphingomonas sp. So64.6b]
MADHRSMRSGYAVYVLVILSMINVFNWMDRTIIAILLDPMKRDLGVSDTAMGLLNGFGFSLLYGVTAIPLARLADRRSRKMVLLSSIAVWSLMTAACGLAGNFLQLLMGRMAVGASEAGATPASQSLITDYFPPERRSVAFGAYATSVYLGTSLSALIGGWLGFHYGWRTALMAVGLPGLALALLGLLTLREPERGRYDLVKAAHRSFRPAIAELATNGTYRWAIAAASMLAIANGATLVWTPALLGRIHHLDLKQLGLTVAIAKGVAGVSGALLGGLLATRFLRGGVYGQFALSALVAALAIPALIVFTQSSSLIVALIGVAVYQVLVGMPIGIGFAAVQGIVAPDVRALAAATVTLFTTVIGVGGGPLLIGFLNDQVTASFGPDAVRYSLLSLAPLMAIGCVSYWRAARVYKRTSSTAA